MSDAKAMDRIILEDALDRIWDTADLASVDGISALGSSAEDCAERMLGEVSAAIMDRAYQASQATVMRLSPAALYYLY